MWSNAYNVHKLTQDMEEKKSYLLWLKDSNRLCKIVNKVDLTLVLVQSIREPNIADNLSTTTQNERIKSIVELISSLSHLTLVCN